jgi:epoxyqueuosine reductase
MANYFDQRLDPTKLVDGAQTVISLTFNYYTQQHLNSDFKIAKYAYGRDYHKVLKSKLLLLLTWLKNEVGDINGRAFVDSAPILEKAWAQRSGLGWAGKNANLITKQVGSFYFLSELIIDFPMQYDAPVTKDYCGSCTKCIDACPTQAITPYVVDGSKCISYLTIELKEAIPEGFKGKMQDWVFGCDICQDVCPWNRFAKQHSEPQFEPKSSLVALGNKEWLELTEDLFDKIFEGTPLKRTKFKGLQRNVLFLDKNNQNNHST